MNNALRTRQRMFALALPLTAALYIGAEGIDPKGTDQIVTTTAVALKVLPIAAKHHTQLYISGSLTELALGALIISYGAIAMLIRKRGSTAATIAVLLGGIGAFCGVIINVLGGINLAAAATAHVPHDAAARLPGYQLQFGARPGIHRRLRLQRVRGADHHGSRPLAQRSCTTLARSSLRVGL